MDYRSNIKKQGSYVGGVALGMYGEKTIAISTWNESVYLHIKDRTRGNRVSLRSADFMQMMKMKDKIISLIEKGSKRIARELAAREQEKTSDSSDKELFISSETDDELDKAIKKVSFKKKPAARKPRKKATESKKRNNDTDKFIDLSESEQSDDASMASPKQKKQKMTRPNKKKGSIELPVIKLDDVD